MVQGVGFRPALHRLAVRLGLAGRVHNAAGLVWLELLGERSALEAFLAALPEALPTGARLDSIRSWWLDVEAGDASTPAQTLLGSNPQAGKPLSRSAVVEPDISAARTGRADLGRAGLRIDAEPIASATPLAIGLAAPSLVADRAPCPDCLRELDDPSSRRHGDPFLSCCACGPRYSIATAEPWCRAHTTQAAFRPCPACAAEFADPADRRFHAETISCPLCGPRLRLLMAPSALMAAASVPGAAPGAARPAVSEATPGIAATATRRSVQAGSVPRRVVPQIGRIPQALAVSEPPPPPPWGASASAHHAALIKAASALLERGGILALQGVGGFQLLVDAANPEAVARLRRRKRRPSKPLALLIADPQWIAAEAWISQAALDQLRSPAAPIVLLPRRLGGGESVSRSSPAVSARATDGKARDGHDPGDSGAAASDPEAFAGVAPGSPQLGVMLPASPLHWLLVRRFGRPLVCTSGNRSGEPLCTDPAEALERLAGLADAFLVHDRPIARPLDDSLLQLIEGRPALLRRARGYAPEPLARPGTAGPRADPGSDVGSDVDLDGAPGCTPSGDREPSAPPAVLAMGGDLKSAPALLAEGRIWLAPHLGDLADRLQHERLAAGVAELSARHHPLQAIVCDHHPGYLSHQLAEELAQALAADAAAPPLLTVQHHSAHALAVVAEHGLRAPLLAFCADGLGYGEVAEASEASEASKAAAVDIHGRDARGEQAPLWGGELLWIGPQVIERLACLRPLPLPGAERACLEPRRVALGLLASAGPRALAHPGAAATLAAFDEGERSLLLQLLDQRLHCPLSSSLGRLFDAVASLLGVCQRLSHEGEAGQRLQGLAARVLRKDDCGASADRKDSLPKGHPHEPVPAEPFSAASAETGAAGAPTPGLRSSPEDLAGCLWPFPLIQPLDHAPGTLPAWIDWQPALDALLAERAAGVPVGLSAARFHLGLAEGLAALLADAAHTRGCRTVVLAGGCFQNALLLEALIARLRRRGLVPFWAEAVPGNDGGLALGQLEAWRRQAKRPAQVSRG